MTIREIYEEMKMVHCENYEVKLNGNFLSEDLGGIQYTINDDEHSVTFNN